MKKRIKIQGILIVLAITAIFLLYKFLFPHWKHEGADEFWDILGVGIILSGFFFRITARGYKEENSLNGKILVRDGPYALMRNPMYFGTLMIGTGFITVLVEWWVLLIFLFIFVLIYVPQVKKEETALLQRFGQAYKDYCKETPRYFPKVSYLLSSRKYLRIKFSWLKKELQSLVAVMICIVIIEIWEDVRMFGFQELFREMLELSLTVAVFVFIMGLFFRIEEEKAIPNRSSKIERGYP